MTIDKSEDPLPSETDKGDTTKITWTIDNISIIAERNDLGRWNVYAKDDDIIVSGVTQNIESKDLLYVVREYKQIYYSKHSVDLA